MAAAWVAGAAIARLTGAAAVILILATIFVGVVFDLVAGWRAVRHPRRVDALGPSVVTAGASTHLALQLVDAPTSWARGTCEPCRDHRIVVRTVSGSKVTSVDVTTRAHTLNAPGTFTEPGVVLQLRVDVEATGPLGLIWWRRPHLVDTDPIHVAPAPAGSALPVERSATAIAGPVSVAAGRHDGDIDGVRPYRPGDAIGSVHWPSSMRSDELIVHDRVATSEERWLLPLDRSDLDGARVRRTLDDGLRLGHAVAIRDAAGDVHPVESADDAGRWAAVVCQAGATAGEHTAVPTSRLERALHTPLRLTRPELTHVDPIARWSAGAAAAASLTMLSGALDTSAAMRLLVAVAIVAGVVVSLRIADAGGTRPMILRLGLGAVLVGALATIVVDAREVDGLLAALRGPLPDLLILLVVLHGFEVADRRTLRAHQAISMVVASYAAGLRIDATLGWWLVVWGGAFTVSALTTSRRPIPRSSAGLSPEPTPARRSAGVALRVAAWACTIAAATLVTLSVVPIPDGPARLGLPALSTNTSVADARGALVDPDGNVPPPDGSSGADSESPNRGLIGDVVGYPGFTESLDTSVRGTLSDDIVMRVRSPEPAFWRGQTFSEFDGRVWSASPDTGLPVDGPVIDVAPTIGDALGEDVPREELVQTYFVEQDLPNLVFAANRPTQVIFDGTLWRRPDGALRADATLRAGSVYTVVSERIEVTAETLRSQGDIGILFEHFQAVAGDNEVAQFLEVPPSTTERTIDLATSLRAPDGNTYDTIVAYQAWLAANTEYDLNAPVPGDGVDAVDDFLFGSGRGFCEQIATALAVMLRTQGVPARLATGYVPGERDRVSGVWKVRGSDAHAWVEVWFPQTGWQAFDPTADVPLAGDATAGTVGGDLFGAAVSSLASHRLQIAGGVAALVVAWTVVGIGVRARRRRRRGRWGLLQDRFNAIGDRRPAGTARFGAGTAGRPPTNPARAQELVAHGVGSVDGADLERLADLLDRVAFDATWVDDDASYADARSIVAALERHSA